MCFVCSSTHLVHEKAVAGELGLVPLLSMHMCVCIHLSRCTYVCMYISDVHNKSNDISVRIQWNIVISIACQKAIYLKESLRFMLINNSQ